MDLILIVLGLVIFYFIVKAAVRNGILEAHKALFPEDSGPKIAQKICPACKEPCDIDFVKCPRCGNEGPWEESGED